MELEDVIPESDVAGIRVCELSSIEGVILQCTTVFKEESH
jgi:hypothetical protein